MCIWITGSGAGWNFGMWREKSVKMQIPSCGVWGPESAFLRSSQLMLTLPVLHDLTSLLWGCYVLQRSVHSKRASLKDWHLNRVLEVEIAQRRQLLRENAPGGGRNLCQSLEKGGARGLEEQGEVGRMRRRRWKAGCWSGPGRGHVGYLRARVPLLIALGSSKMVMLTLSQENSSRQRACASSLFLTFFFLRHRPPPLPYLWSLQRPSPT